MNHMTKVIKLNTEAMKTLVRTLGLSESQAAERIGVKRQTFVRAMEGGNVSAAFVAGVLIGFGLEDFGQMFYTTTREEIAA